jgi:predicted metal-binding membrane protein
MPATVTATGLRRNSRFALAIVALAGAAWLALWLWERSPYGRYLDHGGGGGVGWMRSGPALSLCAALPAGEIVLPAALYIGGWLLMLTAMMLPTTLPLLGIFRRLTAGRADRRVLMTLVIAGYLAVWLLFAAAAHALDGALLALAQRSAWLTFNGWVVGAAILSMAGLYQFSALKYRCLDKCRSPLSFVIGRWRGGPSARRKLQAFRLGVDHGAFCVGCCWSLMLLMFVVGTGSVGWMLALGAVMAAEKNLPWGRRLPAPVGVALLLVASWLVASAAVAA